MSISAPAVDKFHTKIKRRQTGFVRPEDLEKIHVFTSDKHESADDGDDENENTRHCIHLVNLYKIQRITIYLISRYIQSEVTLHELNYK